MMWPYAGAERISRDPEEYEEGLSAVFAEKVRAAVERYGFSIAEARS
jgi:hypothetical protein